MAGFRGKVDGNQQLVLQVVFVFFMFIFFFSEVVFSVRKEGGNSLYTKTKMKM